MVICCTPTFEVQSFSVWTEFRVRVRVRVRVRGRVRVRVAVREWL
jgi:hypothetical protein